MERHNIPPCPVGAMGTRSSLYPREIRLLGRLPLNTLRSQNLG